jgi:hypothetical protein
MLLGDLLTTVQENLPIKIVVYDNGKLGFVDIEQKAAGLVPVYTDLKNPNFAEIAKVVGLWGGFVSKAGELEDSVRTWLSQPGPALLHVKVKPMQLVMPPSPFVSPEALVGMAVYSAKAMLHGKGGDVWEMMVEKLIGKSLRRVDTPDKVNGKAVYGIDARPPGVKIATLANCPVFGGKVAHVSDGRAKTVPGVRQVIVLDDLVAVVGDHMWAAKKGLNALDITWDEGPNAEMSTPMC